MTSTTHRPECTAALYMAVELSAREWWLTMAATPGGARHRARVAPGDLGAVTRAVAAAQRRCGLPATAPVRSCYEAGRDGFWPHRFLTTLGLTNLVVDSSSIEVSRRARRAKTDRLDGQALLRMLQRYWGGERELWQVVHVPTPTVEDARHASRLVTTLQADRTRARNRIHSLLALHGVRLPIDGRFAARLEAARDWQGDPLPPGVVARVRTTWQLLQALDAVHRGLRRTERAQVQAAAPGAAATAHRLVQLRGLAARSATVLAQELFTRTLRNRRQVGALSGLVSVPYRSGQRAVDQGLARSGVPAVRRIAVEIAWAWRRYQPTSALTHWYHARFGSGSPATRRVGIVALARRLLIALWRYVETGVVPEGAQLKA